MANGYFSGAKDIVRITSVNQYFINTVLCFMFISYTSSKADLINDENILIDPLEYKNSNVKLPHLIENEYKNNETSRHFVKFISRNLHLLPFNSEESDNSISKPGCRNDPTYMSNLILPFNNVLNNNEFGTRKNLKNYFEEISRSFVDTEMISKPGYNISRPTKELFDYNNQMKLKNSFHKFTLSTKKLNNTTEMIFNELISERNDRKLKKRQVCSDSKPENKEVLFNSKNGSNINKLTIENAEVSRQNLLTYNQNNDNNDVDYLYDQYKSKSETNENFSLKNSLLNLNNLNENELKRNYTSSRSHRKKGGKKIKLMRNKNLTKNDNNLHSKINNLINDNASGLKSNELINVDPLETSKNNMMGRNEFNKLNHSEKLMLLKNLINKELAEHVNKNKRIPDNLDNDWPQFSNDQPNIFSEEKGYDDEPTTIPISINVFIYDNPDQHTATYNQYSTVSINDSDIPLFLMKPFEEYDPWRFAKPDELDVFTNNSSVHILPEEDSSTVLSSQTPSETPMTLSSLLFQDIDDPVEITILNVTDSSLTAGEPEKVNDVDEDAPIIVDRRKNDDANCRTPKPDSKLCDDDDTAKDMILLMTIISLLAVTVLCVTILTIGWKYYRQKKNSKNNDCVEENNQPQDGETCEEQSTTSPKEKCCQ